VKFSTIWVHSNNFLSLPIFLQILTFSTLAAVAIARPEDPVTYRPAPEPAYGPAPAPAPAYAPAPVPAYAPTYGPAEVYPDVPPQYTFEYAVSDSYSNNFGHTESR